MDAFDRKSSKISRQWYAWHNGSVVPQDRLNISVTDSGFQYGFGFFETVRVDRGLPHNLEAHVARFNRTWEVLFAIRPPDLTWDAIIGQVIAANDLQQKTSAVKIMAAKDENAKTPFPFNLYVVARPYAPRCASRQQPGLHLATFPEPRQTPLASHKTLNYLYYHLAGRWARGQNRDEALILNPDGTVSETNSANLVLVKDTQVVRPASRHVLPGTMEKLVCRLLVDWGFGVTTRPIAPKELFDADQVLVMNSLMGVLPAVSVDAQPLAPATDLWQRINAAIF
jgi:para-aminobenzoate synthetase component 1